MRVGLDTRPLGMAGIGRFVQGLWQALTELGVDVVGLGAPARSEWLGAQALDPIAPTVPVRSRPHRLREQGELPRILRRERIDVYHSPHLTVPHLSGVPVVLTVHDLLPLRKRSSASTRTAAAYLRIVLPAAIKRADRLVAGAHATADELRARFPGHAHKLHVIEYGVDTERWCAAPPAEIARVKGRYGLPERYLLYVGTAKKHKNLGTLLDAHDPVRHPPLVIAGANEDEVGRRDPGVRILGRVADGDLAALYTGAIAVAQPSRAEACGLTALEAMACGTPVVASGTGGLELTVGDAGLLVDPGDAVGWRDALAQVVEDERLRESLADAGLRRAAGRSWLDTGRRYLRVYERALA